MAYKACLDCLKVTTVAVFMLFHQYAAAQNFTALEGVMKSSEKSLGTEVIVVVANKDTVLYQKTPKMFTGKTPVPIGHTSQWLTAAVILTLVDEGKLSLDDKVSSYLPVFEKYGKNFITIGNCLTHFTGIQAEGRGKLFQKDFSSLEEEVTSYAAREIQANPGTEFRYSLIGPAIAARVAEIVTKKRFDMLAQQKVFRPLGMRQTTFGSLNGGAVSAGDGARSTANDLMRFLRMLLNNGSHYGSLILSEKSTKQLRTVVTKPEVIKGTPESQKGIAYSFGAWAPEQSGSTATVLVGPGFDGTLPIVDFCRGYAFLLFVKNKKDDGKANIYAAVKGALDQELANTCK
jgi:CubicO group peptidase (beta-lactamase class C family)